MRKQEKISLFILLLFVISFSFYLYSQFISFKKPIIDHKKSFIIVLFLDGSIVFYPSNFVGIHTATSFSGELTESSIIDVVKKHDENYRNELSIAFNNIDYESGVSGSAYYLVSKDLYTNTDFFYVGKVKNNFELVVEDKLAEINGLNVIDLINSSYFRHADRQELIILNTKFVLFSFTN